MLAAIPSIKSITDLADPTQSRRRPTPHAGPTIFYHSRRCARASTTIVMLPSAAASDARSDAGGRCNGDLRVRRNVTEVVLQVCYLSS
jgi:hypothetical protein